MRMLVRAGARAAAPVRGCIAAGALASMLTLAGCGGSSDSALSSAGTWSGPASATVNVTSDGHVVVTDSEHSTVYPKLPKDKAIRTVATDGVTAAVVGGTTLYVIEHATPAADRPAAVASFSLATGERRSAPQLPAGTTPVALAASADGRKIVVLSTDAAGASTLSVLDTASGAVNSSVRAAGPPPEPFVGVSSDGSRAFVASLSTPDQLQTIDTATGRVLTRTVLAGPVGSVVSSRDGRAVYVTSCTNHSFVAVIAEPSGKLQHSIDTPGPLCPGSVAVSNDGSRLYVTLAGRGDKADSTSGRLLAIDVSEGKVLANVDAGLFPTGVIAMPHDGRLYVPDNDGTVRAFDTH